MRRPSTGRSPGSRKRSGAGRRSATEQDRPAGLTMTVPESRTFRLFLLGAGFSRAAGLPLASELLPLVRRVAREFFRAGDHSHLERALEQYEQYVADVDPGRPFDLEEFGAWLDWEHVLRLK